MVYRQGIQLEDQPDPPTYIVRLSDGRLWKKHQDHLGQRRSDELQQTVADDELTPQTLHQSAISPESPVLPYCKPGAVAKSYVRMQVPTLTAVHVWFLRRLNRA